jgi:hypothetical protein
MSFATLEVADSLFDENTAIDDAGALMTFAQATVTRSTFRKNKAGNDAGAIMSIAELTVENCTFSENEAGTAAPGTGTGGAIKSFDVLNLTASTLTANRAGLAGGGLHTDVDVAQSVQLEGNLVAGNPPDDCGVQAGMPAIHSLGHNLDGDGSCLPTPATGDQTNATPGLGPLSISLTPFNSFLTIVQRNRNRTTAARSFRRLQRFNDRALRSQRATISGRRDGAGPNPVDQACNGPGRSIVTTPLTTTEFTPSQAALR